MAAQILQLTTEESVPVAEALLRQGSPSGSTRSPVRRFLPSDITNPKYRDLVDLALLRVFDAASPLENRPPRLFPTAETIFGRHYTHDQWLAHGDLETELGRMNHMLLDLPERGLPARCIPLVRFVVSSTSALTVWGIILPRLQGRIAKETEWVINRMQKQKRMMIPGHQKSEFFALPVAYRVDAAGSDIALQLWENALLEFVIQAVQGRLKHARAFLQIFAFLKDPLCGLESVSDKAVELFTYMMMSLTSLTRQTLDGPLTMSKWQSAAAQSAQEAIYLADPLLERVEHIHFTGHQQLPYLYVPLDQLPRSEFSIPIHVCRIIEEILTTESSKLEGTCQVAPISVSSYPSLPTGKGKQLTVIIDGNHRATATMIFRLLAENPTTLTTEEPGKVLDKFCSDHELGLKWKIDISEVLQIIRNSHYATLIMENWSLVERFRFVDSIPALLVREDNFHTVCMQRPALEDRPTLLQPIHQALYNDEELGLAFPQSGQVHGRTLGYKTLPLIR